MSRLLLLATLVSSAHPRAAPWDTVTALLQQAIVNETFPGCVALVLNSTGALVYSTALGYQTYGLPALSGGNPALTYDGTLWDMASLTKIMGANTVAAYLYQRGALDPSWAVASPRLLGARFSAKGKGGITVRQLLLHSAGFPADPSPGFMDPAFGCPSPLRLSFSCTEEVFSAVLAQPLAAPPGSAFLYSDLSFITLMYALGALIEREGWAPEAARLPQCAGAGEGLRLACAFEAFWRTTVAPLAGPLPSTGFLPPPSSWQRAAPTWNESLGPRGTQLQGQVCDENSWASGGVQGHAGIFSAGPDVAAFLRAWQSRGGAALNATTIRHWTAVENATFSSRALGWETMAASDSYRGCGAHFSAATYYHTGYTGTQLCVDPSTGVATALLAARVYPNKTAHFAEMQEIRQRFNDAVVAALAASE